ncbi:hypothetical protein MTR67_022815 [Solanum verrucosum]|uniref:Uncharacterized protein n=1 Tax=Solanum verrucosum TaxID=315347 RepID=A0AAF0QYJ3_SOLVR|nr:hypothetical protein MTR67_022815 [Solanum verrucosum]
MPHIRVWVLCRCRIRMS